MNVIIRGGAVLAIGEEKGEALLTSGVTQVPVMLAVDRYNALYAPSDYGQSVGEHKRRMLGAGELRLAAGLRVLEHTAPLKGVCIGALARHDRISRRTPVSPLPLPCFRHCFAAHSIF